MRIRRAHQFALDDARERVNLMAKSLEQRFSLRSHWQGDRLVFDGHGARGDVVIDEEAVELNVQLGFALKFMEPAIRSAIEETLDEQIAAG